MEIMKITRRNLVVIEINTLIIIGALLGNSAIESILIILEFMIIRTLCGAKHYNNQLKCIAMTTILMSSIFLVARVNFGLAVLMTAFASINLSNDNIDIDKVINFAGNILEEGFMFKKRGDTKYSNIDEFVKENQGTEKLRAFEKILQECKDKRLYEVYRIRFYEKAEDGLYVSQTYIENKTGIKHRRLIECLNAIQKYFEKFIEEYEEKQESFKEKQELLKK